MALGLGLLLLLVRWTVRVRVDNDPRPALRGAKQRYVYALLHAHQLAAVIASDEEGLAAMVSQSKDGDLLVPALRLRRITAVRGSSQREGIDKGGRAALARLQSVVEGGTPVLLAVDGPRGPRNRVHLGVVHLARNSGAVILPVVAVASRRWVLTRSWDRFQIPKPFCRICLAFAPPMSPTMDRDMHAARARLTGSLALLETRYDGQEVQTRHAAPIATP